MARPRSTTAHATAQELRRNLIDELEEDYQRVEPLKKALDVAEVKLEETRKSVWQRLGAPFGTVRLGGLRFSRLMVIIGASFAAGILGATLAPLAAFMFAFVVLAIGLLWVRSKF